MSNRQPFQFTFGSPNWRFQIQQGNDQQVVLTRWLQQTQTLAEEGQTLPVEEDQNRESTEEIAIDITGSDGTQPEQASPQNVQNNPLSAINAFLEQNPEVYNLVKTLLTYIPFIVLIFLKEIYQHSTEILIIIALVVTFLHADRTVQREVSKQTKRELGPLAVITLNIIFSILLVHYLSGDSEMYHSLFLFPSTSTPITLFTLLWKVTITDHILKLITILLKAALIALPVLPFSRRGKSFVFIERSSHLYRALAVVPPWIHYLLVNQPSDSSHFYDVLVGICLCGIYLICKAYKAIKLVKKWKKSVTKLLQSTNYGCYPTSEQLHAAGPICPICHDGYRKPTYLDCKHIFCEECLAMWLDRERTCPMCRSTVAEDPKWKDGSTCYFVQLF